MREQFHKTFQFIEGQILIIIRTLSFMTAMLFNGHIF